MLVACSRVSLGFSGQNRDSQAYIEPPSKHLGPVLLNLQPLDVDVRQHHAHRKGDAADADAELDLDAASKSMSRRHESTHGADEGQDQDDVTVQSMKQEGLVPNGRDELKTDKKTGGEDSREVHADANLGDAASGPVALADARGPAKVSVVIEVHEPGEDETHQASGKGKEENEVVAFGEPNRVVEFPGGRHKGVRRWAVAFDHGGLVAVKSQLKVNTRSDEGM
jgi:hypothetical protein